VRHLDLYTCMVGETPSLPRTLRGSFLPPISSLSDHLGMVCMSSAYILQLRCTSRRSGRVGDHDELQLLSLVGEVPDHRMQMFEAAYLPS
jgi:hypothetical protein